MIRFHQVVTKRGRLVAEASMAELYRHLTWAAISDTGRRRKNNEDAYGVFASQGVFCVADGMGGGDEGEVASRATVDYIGSALARQGDAALAGEAKHAIIVAAVNDASLWICKRSGSRGGKSSGSTLVALLFDAGAPVRAIALHAGDSRLYRLRKRNLTQITRDHSVASLAGVQDEQVLDAAFRGVIMRAVGVKPAVELERTPVDIAADDVLLLCSDGLTRMLSDREIQNILVKQAVMQEAAVALVAAANNKGGKDNITVVLVRVSALPQAIATVQVASGDETPTSETATQSTATSTPSSLDTSRESVPSLFAADSDEVMSAKLPELSEPPTASPPSSSPGKSIRMPRRRLHWPLMAIAGCLVGLGAAFFALRPRHPVNPAPRPQPVLFRLQGSPPEELPALLTYRRVVSDSQAWISASNHSVSLLPGCYEAQVAVPDYEPLRLSFAVSSNRPPPVTFELRQLRPGESWARLMLATNEAAAGRWAQVEAYFNGDPGGTLVVESHVRIYRELLKQWQAHKTPPPSGCAVRFANTDKVSNPQVLWRRAEGEGGLPLPNDTAHFDRHGDIPLSLQRADYLPVKITLTIFAGETGTLDVATLLWKPGPALAALGEAEVALQADRVSDAQKKLGGISDESVFVWDAHRERYRAVARLIALRVKQSSGCAVGFTNAANVGAPPVAVVRRGSTDEEAVSGNPVRFERSGEIAFTLHRPDYRPVPLTVQIQAGQTGSIDLATISWIPVTALSSLIEAETAAQAHRWQEAQIAVARIADSDNPFAWEGHRARWMAVQRMIAQNQTPTSPPSRPATARATNELQALACDTNFVVTYQGMLGSYGAKGQNLAAKIGRSAAALSLHNTSSNVAAFADALFEAARQADHMAQDLSAEVETRTNDRRLTGDPLQLARAKLAKLEKLISYAAEMEKRFKSSKLTASGSYSLAAQLDVVMFTRDMADCVTCLQQIVANASHK